MDIGDRLKEEGAFPGPDDYIPALDLVVRHCSKSRWFEILGIAKLRLTTWISITMVCWIDMKSRK